MDVVVWEFCGDYDFRAFDAGVFLWGGKAGVCGRNNYYDDKCDIDDATDNFVFLWDGVVNFSAGEFADFADVAVCDGAGIFDGSFCGGAFD